MSMKNLSVISSFFLFFLFFGAIINASAIEQLDQIRQKIIKIVNTIPNATIRSKVKNRVTAGFIQAKQTITKEISEIKFAAAFTSVLEVLAEVLNGLQLYHGRSLLNEVKYSARANAFHKLILGIIPDRLTLKDNYTCPCWESLGFIANDWLLNKVTQIAVVKSLFDLAATKIGVNNTVKAWAKRVLAGIAAHFAWGMEKYLLAK